MSAFQKLRKHGLMGSARKIAGRIGRTMARGYHLWAARGAEPFANPTPSELEQIEKDLSRLGIAVHDWAPRAAEFTAFKAAGHFDHAGYASADGSVWDEKVLEHWIAAERLQLMNYQPGDIYVDIAAGNSPWAHILRTRLGISALAIDLGEVGEAFRELSYYRTVDATATGFADASVRGVSLQCAYEMFVRDDDTRLLAEVARILAPGGKAVIVPLYLHTHYCAYATPEHYGKGNADPRAKEYVCRDWRGIPSARFYDAQELRNRVLATIERLGMRYELLALRNKSKLGEGVYCHFVLEITR